MDYESEIIKLRAALERSERKLVAAEEALDHRQREIDAMRRTAEALFALPSVEAMLQQTIAVAIEVLRADGGLVLLHNAEKDVLIFRYVLGPSADKLIGYELPVSRGVTGQVFRTGEPARTDDVEDLAEHHSVDERTGYRVNSMMSAPLKRAGHRPFGVINVVNARHSFDDRDLHVLEVLAAVAAASIENARLSHEARKAEIVNLIGKIAHDVTNMLTPIQSGTQTLKPILDDLLVDLDDLCSSCAEGETWGEKIEQSLLFLRSDYAWILDNTIEASERVEACVRGIAEAVKGEISPPQFKLAQANDTAREAVRSLRSVASQAQVHLLLELHEDLPLVEFDTKQIYYAIYNLVNNAIHETPADGSVTIRTGLDEGKLLIEVADTGRGIPEHVREKLFTDQAVSTKPSGTGLGTRIVYNVVQRHNGNINLESEEGRGSTFSIRLPLLQS
jgi:signal transduction histidine kinase